jgi:hypothetical protein
MPPYRSPDAPPPSICRATAGRGVSRLRTRCPLSSVRSEAMRCVLDFGVDGLISDRPDFAIEELKKRK